MTEQLAVVPNGTIVVVHSTSDYRPVEAKVISPDAQAVGEATRHEVR